MLLSLSLLILCMPLLQGCGESDNSVVEKQPAPDFTLKLFDGGTFRLSDYRGRPVIINFFASWCIPCKAEAPHLERVYREYAGQEVMVVGIALQDTQTKARAFVKEHRLTFPTGLDTEGTIKESYRVFGLPMTIFVDRTGLIGYTHAGMATEDLLRHELEKII